MSHENDSAKGLFKVMVIATAVSFGCLGAIIVSMKDFFGGNAAFEFSYKTVLGFFAGALVGWSFWIGFRRLTQRNHDSEH